MSLAKRIIPCLDVDAGRVVKGVNFVGIRDAGDPVELGAQYAGLKRLMPWLAIFGGCCGSDLRHVARIAETLSAMRDGAALGDTAPVSA